MNLIYTDFEGYNGYKPISHSDLVNAAKAQFSKDNNILIEKYRLKVGINVQKECIFDLGNEEILIFCKSNSWKKGSFVPKNIFHTWNEAMYYFHLIPKKYQKIFFVKMDFSQRYCETLLQYYIRNNFHFIPDDVTLYDYYGRNSHVDKYTYDTIKKLFGGQ